MYWTDEKAQLVLNYLNAGGSPSGLVDFLSVQGESTYVTSTDLTGDGVPELFVIVKDKAIIFGCGGGAFHILFDIGCEGYSVNGMPFRLIDLQDMNLNGIPEIILAEFGCGGQGRGRCLAVIIFEWTGSGFYGSPVYSLTGGRSLRDLPEVLVRDIDGNGTYELILHGGIMGGGEYFCEVPWREETHTYMWNGETYALYSEMIAPPQYRYQAVQDADRAALHGDYAAALSLYWEAIDSQMLDWWSPERFHYICDNAYRPSEYTPLPVPVADPAEYENLAAYSYYRLMLTHLLQGNLDEAAAAYDWLQSHFPEGRSGHAYALLAQTFWQEYQSSQNIARACSTAVHYAEEMPDEILAYLGGSYHNIFQDDYYEPEDICPFR